MLKKLLNGKSSTITSAAVIIGVTSLLSRILGVVRDRILAGQFGAGTELDIYYAAFRIPDLVFNLLVLGALSAGFIPIFSRLIGNWDDPSKNNNKDSWQFVNNLLNISGVILLILCALLIIFCPFIMRLIAPGFSKEKLDLTIALSRIMFLSPIFLTISSIFGGVLQSFKRFVIYSLAPVVYNIGIIVGALFLVPIWGLDGLAYGVVLGAFFHMLIQIPPVFHLGYYYRWVLSFTGQGMKQIAKLMIPRTISIAIVQVNLLVITIIASTLREGSLAVFNFADNLQSFPVGIFGISYAIAAFPTMAEFVAKKDHEGMVKNFSSTVRQILFFIIPASILFLTLRAQIVRVVLGTGKFDWTDTILTADALAFLSLSLFAQALTPLLNRTFYALHNTLIPFIVGLISAMVNIAAALILVKPLGVVGLSLAFAISCTINLILLWVALKIKVGSLDEFNITRFLMKVTGAAAVMGVSIQIAKGLIAPLVDMNRFWGIFTQGLVAGLVGIGVFIVICLLLRCQEMIVLKESLKKKFFKVKPQGEVGEAGV